MIHAMNRYAGKARSSTAGGHGCQFGRQCFKNSSYLIETDIVMSFVVFLSVVKLDELLFLHKIWSILQVV